MKNKILFLIPNLKIAGAEKVVIDLADKLAESEYQIGIISLSEDVPFFSRVRNKNTIKLYTCGKSTFRFPWFSLKRLILFRKAIKQFKPNIVHSHLWSIHCIYLLLFFSKRKKSKIYHTIHITDSHYTDDQFIYKFFRFVEIAIVKFLNSKVISISEEVDMLCKKKLRFKDVCKISNGINTDYYKPIKADNYVSTRLGIPKDSFVILNIGRYHKQKGQIFLLKALHILIKNGCLNCYLVFAGKDIEQNLKTQVRALKLEEYVKFVGVFDNIPRLVAVADIGVFPSLYEGFGLACGEMMSCGLPTIISNIPPLVEMSRNGQGALITPVGQSDAIADAILNLKNNKILRRNLSITGRKIIQNDFSLDCQVQKHIEIYNG